VKRHCVEYKLKYNIKKYIYNTVIYKFIYFFSLDYNSSYMFRPNCGAIFRQIFEQARCTVDNVFNLRDFVFQELVKIIAVCYIKTLRLNFKCGALYSKN
jgi:hypothetical protein